MTKEEANTRARVRYFLAKGLNHADVARKVGISRERVGQIAGRVGKRDASGPPRPAHRVYARNAEFRKASLRAKELGCILLSGQNTGKGSTGLMLEGIGAGTLTVIPTQEYDGLRRLAVLGAGFARVTLDPLREDDGEDDDGNDGRTETGAGGGGMGEVGDGGAKG